MEIGGDHLNAMSESFMEELRKVTADLGLEMSVNIGPAENQDVASDNKNIRENGIKYFKDTLQRMDKIGASVLGGALYTYWPSDWNKEYDKEKAWKNSIESLKEVGKAAVDLNKICSLEILNRYEGYILTGCEEGLEYVERIGCPNIKLLLDTFHMSIEEDNLPEAFRLVGKKLGHVHLGEGNRKLPGFGYFPWKEIGRALRDIEFNGYAVMEPFMKKDGQIGKAVHLWRDFWPQKTEQELDEMLADSLAYVKSCFEIS
jgi:D-psicose/D-tagatose/L-ribulose 3-epimerase